MINTDAIFSKLSLGDLEDFENATGQTFQDLINSFETEDGTDAIPPMSVLVPLCWIFLRTTNPEATIDDARRLTLEEMMRTFQGDTEQDSVETIA